MTKENSSVFPFPNSHLYQNDLHIRPLEQAGALRAITCLVSMPLWPCFTDGLLSNISLVFLFPTLVRTALVL